MRILAASILCFIFLASCEDRRSLQIDDFEKEVVLNSIISTDNQWEISLNYTNSIFDNTEFEIINEAEVFILDLETQEKFYLDFSRAQTYKNEAYPEEGHHYQVCAKVGENPIIKSTSYIPNVLDVNVNQTSFTDENGQAQLEIDIELNDNPLEDNYYMLELLPANNPESNIDPTSNNFQNQINDNSTSKGDVQINGDRPVVKDENVINIVSNKESISKIKDKALSSPVFLTEADVYEGKISNTLILTPEVLTSNQTIEGPIGTPENTNTTTTKPRPKFQLNVMAVSSELYNFLQSYENYKNSSFQNSSVSDPESIYSNIINGRGVFGGYIVKTYTIY